MDIERVLAIAILENYSTYLWHIEKLGKVVIEDMNILSRQPTKNLITFGANF